MGVRSDLIDLATSRDQADHPVEPIRCVPAAGPRRWLVRTQVGDVPGALGRLTTAIGAAELSIDTLHGDRHAGVDLVVGPAREAHVHAALPEARILPVLDRPMSRTPGV